MNTGLDWMHNCEHRSSQVVWGFDFWHMLETNKASMEKNMCRSGPPELRPSLLGTKGIATNGAIGHY